MALFEVWVLGAVEVPTFEFITESAPSSACRFPTTFLRPRPLFCFPLLCTALVADVTIQKQDFKIYEVFTNYA